MFALCVESSHARGMGHFFRVLNLATALREAGENCHILINSHEPALRLLQRAAHKFTTVDLGDVESDWEGRFITHSGIRAWVNDRLDTDLRHAANVKRRNVPLVTFDDRGAGGRLADINIAAMSFDLAEVLPGHKVLRGIEYLILNPEIASHRRIRRRAQRLLVTLGGSDTYGVTIKVVRCLRRAGLRGTVVVGPGFRHDVELAQILSAEFELKRNPPSLIEEFDRHDLAITGGGITPFEANAAGLPCIVIASEPFEIPVARELERLGGSVFAGYYVEMQESVITQTLPVETMSRTGMERIGLDGVHRVVRELTAL